MTRFSHFLLLAAALAAITFVASHWAALPPAQVLVLVGAGVLAQGFASWRPAEPRVVGLDRPGRLQRGLAWLLRAAIGIAVLSAMVWAALLGPAQAVAWLP